jgi:drug/metabolite transporter (DMT)-like permease
LRRFTRIGTIGNTHGGAIRVTSLFYLMPPTTALMGYFLFGETFGAAGFAGLFIAMLGFSVVYHFKRR